MALSVEPVRESRVKRLLRWMRDRVWPMLDPPSGETSEKSAEPNLEPGLGVPEDVVRDVFARLSAELEAEADRRRAVENKLLAVGAVAPIAVTIMVAVVSFLSSGRARDFVPVSVLVMSVMAFYVALQLLRAMLAAIGGLQRMPYQASLVSDIIPVEVEDRSTYLRRACRDVVQKLEQHRAMNDEKVSQLAVAHESMTNAGVALVLGLVVFVGVVVCQACGDP